MSTLRAPFTATNDPRLITWAAVADQSRGEPPNCCKTETGIRAGSDGRRRRN